MILAMALRVLVLLLLFSAHKHWNGTVSGRPVSRGLLFVLIAVRNMAIIGVVGAVILVCLAFINAGKAIVPLFWTMGGVILIGFERAWHESDTLTRSCENRRLSRLEASLPPVDHDAAPPSWW